MKKKQIEVPNMKRTALKRCICSLIIIGTIMSPTGCNHNNALQEKYNAPTKKDIYTVSVEKNWDYVSHNNEILFTIGNADETTETTTEETITKEESSPTEHTFKYNYYSSSSYIKNSSGLTSYQINELLRGTSLYGIGEAVYDIENTYNINAYFTISVASLESGYGDSHIAQEYNNIFGMKRCTFNSFDSSVYYFGELIDSYDSERGLNMSPDGINPTYCEEDDWSSKVTTLMNQYVDKANNLFCNKNI